MVYYSWVLFVFLWTADRLLSGQNCFGALEFTGEKCFELILLFLTLYHCSLNFQEFTSIYR